MSHSNSFNAKSVEIEQAKRDAGNIDNELLA